MALVTKAENDWQNGQPQVAMQHYLSSFLYSILETFCCYTCS